MILLFSNSCYNDCLNIMWFSKPYELNEVSDFFCVFFIFNAFGIMFDKVVIKLA